MNWIKHIFIKSKKDDELTKSLKKKLFEKLYKFAKNEPSFAFEELQSAPIGLNEEEVEKRLTTF